MINDYTVNVVYKNRNMEQVFKKNYQLADYCQEQKINILKVISDVENSFYRSQDGFSKESWPQPVIDEFQRIRHKLLDIANSIERLPQNLCFKGQNIGSIDSSVFIGELINTYLPQENDAEKRR